MGNYKRRTKEFSKPHNSQILKVQVVEEDVVRVGQKCSYLVKCKKIGITFSM
jgi:hypothetical protein